MSGKELIDLPLLEIKDYIESHSGLNIDLTRVNVKARYNKKPKIHKFAELRIDLDDEGETVRITLYRADKVIRGKVDIMTGKVLELSRWRLVYSYISGGRKRSAGNILLEEYKYDREGVS